MPEPYEVRNTEMSDLGLIFELFEQSINYQEKKGIPFGETMIEMR